MSSKDNDPNGFRFIGKGDGSADGGADAFYEADDELEEDEDEEEHEHLYISIAQTKELTAYEEAVHKMVSLEFHERGLTLDLTYEEATELGQVMAQIVAYLNGKQAIEP